MCGELTCHGNERGNENEDTRFANRKVHTDRLYICFNKFSMYKCDMYNVCARAIETEYIIHYTVRQWYDMEVEKKKFIIKKYFDIFRCVSFFFLSFSYELSKRYVLCKRSFPLFICK